MEAYFLLTYQFIIADWGALFPIGDPQTQARDFPVCNPWLSRLPHSLPFCATARGKHAQNLMAHVTSTHIFREEKYTLAKQPCLATNLTTGGSVTRGDHSCPCPDPAHTNFNGSASFVSPLSQPCRLHPITHLIKNQFIAYLPTLITSYLYIARNGCLSLTGPFVKC